MRTALRKAFSNKSAAQRISIESWITAQTRGCCKVSFSFVEPGAKMRSVSEGQAGDVMAALAGNDDMDIGTGMHVGMITLTRGNGVGGNGAGISMAMLTRGKGAGVGMAVLTRGNKVGVAALTRGDEGVGTVALTGGDRDGMPMLTGGDRVGVDTPRPPAEVGPFQDGCCQSSCELKNMECIVNIPLLPQLGKYGRGVLPLALQSHRPIHPHSQHRCHHRQQG